MAQRQYDLLLTDNKFSLTDAAGSSIATSAMRVTVDDTNCPSRADLVRLIELFKQHILERTWPPS